MFIEPLNNSVLTRRLIQCGVVLGAFLFGHLLGQSEYNKTAQRLLLSEAERSTLDMQNRQMSSELSAMVQKAYTNDGAVAMLQQSLSELRVQRIKERDELQIYRNLATGGENITGIAIDDVAITASQSGLYGLGLRLTQPRGRKRVAGTVHIQVVGKNAAGEALALSLEEIRHIAPDGQKGSSPGPSDTSGKYPAFEFRYYQQFQSDLSLPEGFTPEFLKIVANPVNPYRSSVKKVSLTVPWETSQSDSLASLTD